MLAVKLKPGERIVVNGAVLCNGNARNTLYFANTASILREKDVMQVEEASSPVARAYYLVQLMMLNADDLEVYRPSYEKLMTQLLQTFTNIQIRQKLVESAEWVLTGNYYKALVALRPVRDYETALLTRTKDNAADATMEESLE
jgi:flagellar biosynthesis repressor protein FlbT